MWMGLAAKNGQQQTTVCIKYTCIPWPYPSYQTRMSDQQRSPLQQIFTCSKIGTHGVVFSLEVEDYIVSDWYCCYISTMQQGENILPVSYQVLQQHP